MSNRYSAERYKPKIPTCGPAPFRLRFDDHFLHATGQYLAVFHAISGKPVNGRFIYSTENQKIPDQGPIPESEYWIQPSEIQENTWYRFRNSQVAWGDFWLTIHPYPKTNTYNRGGFFIHGGNVPWSAGYIDLSIHINTLVKLLRSPLGQFSKCYIPLTVRYLNK